MTCFDIACVQFLNRVLPTVRSTPDPIRDIVPLRGLLDGARSRQGEITFTDTVSCKLHTIKCFNTRRNLRLFEFGSGATMVTSNEAVFILESKSMAVDFEYELHLDKRICVYPQRKFLICERGIIGEGSFTRPLPSNLEPTLLEKLMEDFEFIPRDLAVQIRNEIHDREEDPYSTHLDIVD
ncbi:unnamed protein product [Cylicocyclus nassatus]|uniref:Uncharacterized protein n=1 Tax=Cylicocyclus nassatus TaxID=53992 RepID=A0AA36M3E4_CYLNA|nr:unnamed protein product [Cylicocyclus nassatus]